MPFPSAAVPDRPVPGRVNGDGAGGRSRRGIPRRPARLTPQQNRSVWGTTPEDPMSESSGPNDWNRKVIEEFRANAGKVGGYFEGAPMVLVHHLGARTGTERVTPLVYL